MKRLKTYKLFESVHDTKEGIEEIFSTCKDIMLEAQDTFGNSDVEKSYKDDKVIITCVYKIGGPIGLKSKLQEYKSTMDDIHARLIEYMTSQGFTYINRGDKSTAYFDMMSGRIIYNISFSKELDKEFIAHLRYLKRYNINESIDVNIKSDIEDIALELTDCKFYYEISDRKYWKNRINSEEALIIYLRDNQNRFFTIKDIEDVLLRLKDYLKDTDYSIDLSIPDSDDYPTFDEFMEDFSKAELYHVNIIIYYNPRISSFQRKYAAHEDLHESKQLEASVIDECKDILVELEDKGIETGIRSYFNTGISLVKKAKKDSKRKRAVDVNKYNKNWITIYLNRKEEFTYLDIEDVVERLKSYLAEFGLYIEWQSPTERKEQRPTIKTTRVMDPMTFLWCGVETECELYFSQK